MCYTTSRYATTDKTPHACMDNCLYVILVSVCFPRIHLLMLVMEVTAVNKTVADHTSYRETDRYLYIYRHAINSWWIMGQYLGPILPRFCNGRSTFFDQQPLADCVCLFLKTRSSSSCALSNGVGIHLSTRSQCLGLWINSADVIPP